MEHQEFLPKSSQDFLASLLEDPLNGDPQDWEALYEHETGDKSLNNLNTEELQVLLLWKVEAWAWAWAEDGAGARARLTALIEIKSGQGRAKSSVWAGTWIESHGRAET